MIPPKKAIVALVFFLSYWAVSSHAFADRSIELFLQLGHTDSVRSVAFSPDGTRLALGSLDGTINIWDAISGAIRVSMALLPGNEWIAYQPQKLVYNSSLQGDEYAAIRFDNQIGPVYPLKYYRQVLKRPDLEQALLLPQPVIKPQPIRLWWDRFENKGFWFGVLLFGFLTGATVTFILRRRSDPMEVAKQFWLIVIFGESEACHRDERS
jgi:WD domain, G-beta repeat